MPPYYDLSPPHPPEIPLGIAQPSPNPAPAQAAAGLAPSCHALSLSAGPFSSLPRRRLPRDRYLEDTHSQSCLFLQFALLAGGLGGLPSQAIFVPPAAHVLTDRQNGGEMRKTTGPQVSLLPRQISHSTHTRGVLTMGQPQAAFLPCHIHPPVGINPSSLALMPTQSRSSFSYLLELGL